MFGLPSRASGSNPTLLDALRSTEVEECADVDTSKMQAKMEFVGIGRLAAYVDRNAPVDVLAVVTTVGALGSVKRKTDMSEVARRDVTLVDSRCVWCG